VLPLCSSATPYRNWVLATNTLQAAQSSADNAPGSPVVAIVGKGHIPGMVYVMESIADVFARALGSSSGEIEEAEAAATAATATSGS
jgi:pheromone shutdown protein TraB